MLRKDVKLGLAIGGIMLAVVVVYVLVVPGDRKQVSVVNDDSQTKTDTTQPSADVGDAKSVEPDVTSSSNAPPAVPANADQSPTTSPSVTATPAASTPTAGSNSGSSADWNKLLSQGDSSPTMMTQTPTQTQSGDHQAARGDTQGDTQNDTTPSNSGSAAPTPEQVASAVNDAPPASPASPTSAAPVEKMTPDLGMDTSTTPATQPADSTARTHIVQPGEMLTSIAAAAYGDAKKWKKIAEANPSVNPNRMAPGTKLVIPILASYTQSSSHSSSASAAPLDPQTQYQVEPSDSLYRISMKLYGKPNHVDQLYQDNKDVIGSDPRRLKLNMILKLTDPPTTSTTASR